MSFVDTTIRRRNSLERERMLWFAGLPEYFRVHYRFRVDTILIIVR